MAETQTTEIPRLKARYREEIIPALRSEFDIANVMQVPGLVKIVVNMGVGEAARDSKLIEGAIRDLTAITGQKPTVTKARKSIAQFKLREGMPIGAHVTLRGDRMCEFADRLLHEAGVCVLAGTAFGGVGVDHVRISYANSRENLTEALGRIRTFVDGLGRG